MSSSEDLYSQAENEHENADAASSQGYKLPQIDPDRLKIVSDSDWLTQRKFIYIKIVFAFN